MEKKHEKIVVVFWCVFVVNMALAAQTVTIDGLTIVERVLGNGPDANGSWIGIPSELLLPDDNTVNIINNALISADIYGGYADDNAFYYSANNNRVNIYDSAVDKNVYGGHSVSYSGVSAAYNNNVTINRSSMFMAYGGYAKSDKYFADASYNSITIVDGSFIDVDGGVIGGWAEVDSGSGSAEANENSVTVLVSSSWVVAICGGYAGINSAGTGSTNANSNSVTITNGMAGYIFGGQSVGGAGTSAADNNNVMVNRSSAVAVIGGYARNRTSAANAKNNSVMIIDSMLVEGVIGGWAEPSGSGQFGDATNNSVAITGGSVSEGVVCGGRSEINASAGEIGAATNNTVTISGEINLTGTVIFGGFVGGNNIFGAPAAGMDMFTGNTLNVRDYRGSPIKSVQNFEYYNFTFSGNQNGPVLIVTGTAALSNGTGSGSTVTGVNTIAGTPALKAGSSVTLIQASTLTRSGFAQTQTEGKHGSFLSYSWTLNASTATGKLTATVVSVEADKKTKIISEGAAAGAILAGLGADNINGGLLSGLQEGKSEVLASVFGGSSKYDTGSSVEMNGFGLAAGVAKKFSSFAAGIFAEYANASFDTEYKGLTGDGSASAIGGGILVKKDLKEDFYAEGLIRIGQLANDYKANISGTTADYDYSSMYFGFALGIGQIFKISEKINLDCFGKYALTGIGESETNLASGEKYKIDSGVSSRVKAGAKSEFAISDAFKPYITLSYDYELSGEIKSQIDGCEIEAPTLNGGTFSGGIGASVKVMELTLDLSGQFYSGVREGVTGNLRVKYEF